MRTAQRSSEYGAQGGAVAKPTMAEVDKHEVYRGGGRGRRAPRPISGAASSGAQPRAAAGADPRRRRAAKAARPVAELGARVKAGETYEITCPAPAAGQPAGGGDRARHRLRGRAPHRHRQADGARRASRPRPRQRHAGQRADRPLRRQPLRHRRRQAAGHRASPRQGHDRPDGGGQDRPRASGPRRAVRRARRRRPPRARATSRSSGACRTGRAARSTRRSPAAPPTAPRSRSPSASGAGGAPSRTTRCSRPSPPAAREPLASLLRLVLETGRTHQVRVHLAHIGHPLLGDMTYGAGFKASARKLPAKAQAALTGARPAGPACRRARLRAPGDRAAAGLRKPAAGRHGGPRRRAQVALNCQSSRQAAIYDWPRQSRRRRTQPSPAGRHTGGSHGQAPGRPDGGPRTWFWPSRVFNLQSSSAAILLVFFVAAADAGRVRQWCCGPHLPATGSPS